MSNRGPIDVLKDAVDRSDLEAGMEIIDGIGDWADMESATALLREREKTSASSVYLLGHLWVRYRKWEDAHDCFRVAAALGINSANYRAGLIVRDHGAGLSNAPRLTALELFAIAAQNGHIWSRQIVLREKAKLSATANLRYWLHRLIFLPFSLLAALAIKSQRDRMRY